MSERTVVITNTYPREDKTVVLFNVADGDTPIGCGSVEVSGVFYHWESINSDVSQAALELVLGTDVILAAVEKTMEASA